MSEEVAVETPRARLIEELAQANYTSYFVATHPKYARTKLRFAREPAPLAVPYMWKYSDAKKKLLELGELLTTEEAERRNLNFVNPGLKGIIPAATLPALRAGIQLLKPGERAYTHRHNANASRFVLEAPSEGAYTVVEGYRLPMHPGDFIVTPNWTWHDHHNEGDREVIWLDGLPDTTLAFWLGGVFYEEFEEAWKGKYQPVTGQADDLLARYGLGLRPVSETYPKHLPASNNPLLYYPYNTVFHALSSMAERTDGSPQDGIVVEYTNPITGGHCFPSASVKMRLIKPKVELPPLRRLANILSVTFYGRAVFGLSDGQEFATEPFDVVTIPPWTRYRIKNLEDKPAILLSVSDEPLFSAIGFYREEGVTST